MTTDSSMNDVDSANGDVMVSTDLTGRGTPTIYFVLPCYNEAEGL